MRGVIEQTKPSQSGKSMGVLIDGVWYSCKDHSIGNHQGMEIIGDTSVQALSDGGSINWINSFNLVDSSAALITVGRPEQNAQMQVNEAAPQGRTNKDRWIFMQAIVKTWISPQDTIDDVYCKCQNAWVLSGTVAMDEVEAASKPLPDPKPDPVQSGKSGW